MTTDEIMAAHRRTRTFWWAGLALSLGTLAYLFAVGSSLHQMSSTLSGGALVVCLLGGFLLTAVALGRAFRYGRPGALPFQTGIVVACAASVLSTLLLVGTISSLLFSMLGDLDFTEASRTATGAEAMRPWALPADPDIDAVEAGRAVARLIAVRPERWQGVESSPYWAEVALVARAPHVDLLAGQRALPLPDSIDIFDLPFIPAPSLRRMGEANGTRIDEALRRGDRDGARRAAQELLSFGLRLYDASRNEAQVLLGLTLTAMGREQLTRTLRALNDPEAERIVAVSPTDQNRFGSPRTTHRTSAPEHPAKVRASILKAARAPSPPSVRWEMLRMLAILPCTNTRTLAFGPDAETREAIAGIRAALARTASDSAMVMIAEETPERRGRRLVEPEPEFIEYVARLGGRLLGNPRLAGCVTGFAGS